MRSTAVDSILVLLDRTESCSAGCTAVEAAELASNDDIGVAPNPFDSQIVIMLPPGTYIIVASEADLVPGGYTLETSF